MRRTLQIVAFALMMPVGSMFAQEISPAITTDNTTTELETKKKIKKKKPSEETLKQEFFQAVETGDLDQVATSLDAMKYYQYNATGETALTLAIQQENEEMVRQLTEGAVINLKNKAGETPLTLALKKKNHAIIQMVLKRAKAGLKNDAGEAPLMLAMDLNDLELLQTLIEKGADVNRKTNGITPIAKATQMNQVKMVALLVRNGADPSQPNDDGDIPLYIAVRNGYNIISGILLHKSEQASIDANWKTEMGETLLNIAIEEGHEQVARLLLDFGADIEGMDYLENTALNLASEKGSLTLVTMLLEKGANYDHVNIMGTSPIMAAAQNGHTELADKLASLGANPSQRNFEGLAAQDYGNFRHSSANDELMNAVFELTEEK